jgi:hypothetical protein
MTTPLTDLSPVQQAEYALQVERVLRRMERRFTAGAWTSGARVDGDGGTCLVGAIDEATPWCIPGVAEEVTDRLAARLPRPLRAIARARPRLALAMFNDTFGERRSRMLVQAARQDLLTGAPAPVSASAPHRTARSGAGRA